ncbi:SAV_915 family protein [Actinoplanes subtropicus]|uniref:SAV_915 family protein n=1 Tax=Actinoplanes subtropicus TaxID=543632 RepID=UPI001FE14424|nr:SAV_915 family protein [Actinoplanes subtropicus]
MTIDLRVTRDGRLALLVYSAMDRLIKHCGPAQPWTVMLTKDLEQARLATGFELILLDLDIPEELRRTGEEI